MLTDSLCRPHRLCVQPMGIPYFDLIMVLICRLESSILREMRCIQKTNLIVRSNVSKNIKYDSRNRHSPKHPLPEFLVPNFFIHSNPHLGNGPSLSIKARYMLSQRLQACRCFSTSPKPQATAVTANARKDEEGKEMMIDITARAANVSK